MAPNPWNYNGFDFSNGNVELILTKRDVRGGFDLGRFKEKKEVILENIDYNNCNKNYWKDIFNYINNYNENNIKIPKRDANSIIKRIKKYRYFERLPMRKGIKEGDRYKIALINRYSRKIMKNNSLKNKLSLFIKLNTILLKNLFD